MIQGMNSVLASRTITMRVYHQSNEHSSDEEHLYWTGAVPDWDGSEFVGEYSKRLIDECFPTKV